MTEDIDPLGSPGQLEHMLSICEAYSQWLRSGNSADADLPVPKAGGPWDNPASQMLLYALCLKSLGHLDAIYPAQFGGSRRLFKTKLLALGNK